MDFSRSAVAKAAVLAAALVFFGTTIARAPAQPVTPPIVPPAPTFNPTVPSTVPQAPPAPVSPGLPSSGPGSVAVPPASEDLPPVSPSPRTRTANPDTGPVEPHYRHHHARGRHLGYGLAASYRLPLDYHGPYCSWSPGWDFYWHPVCLW